jgi:hypothetical protein
MPVTNDGFGNEFIGNLGGGVSNAILKVDLITMLANKGITQENYNSFTFAIRFPEDTLTGIISSPPGPVTNLSTIANNARVLASLGGYWNNTSDNGCFALNASTTTTAVTVRADTIPYSSMSSFTTNSNTQAWAVASSKNVSVFLYRTDTGDYSFISVGHLNNFGNAYSFPASAYGICLVKNGASFFSSFKTVSNGSTTPVSILKKGALNTQAASANYPHLVASGTQGDNTHLGLRRSDNDYLIGTVNNVFKGKSTLGYAVGDTVKLNNITQGNTSIDSSTNNVGIVVGRLSQSSDNDHLGDYLIMRIKNV